MAHPGYSVKLVVEGPHVIVQKVKTMSTSFVEFLRQRADESGIRQRNLNRLEWLKALQEILAQIDEWLRAADTDNLLDIARYKVERVEDRLGVYDAPALKIRLGADDVDIVPVGRSVCNWPTLPAH